MIILSYFGQFHERSVLEIDKSYFNAKNAIYVYSHTAKNSIDFQMNGMYIVVSTRKPLYVTENIPPGNSAS